MAWHWTWSWLLTLLTIQIGCGSANETIYPSVETGVGWAENLSLQNFDAETARPAVYSALPNCLKKDPVTLCTQYCLKRLEFCSSFSYVNTSRHCICKLYKSPSFLIENMNPREGSRYFYATKEKCPVNKGYHLLHFELDRNICLLYLGKMKADALSTTEKCRSHGGVMPKLTNKYVTDVIVEFVGANTQESTILIQAGTITSYDGDWLWEFDGTRIPTHPRSSSEDSRDDPTYWNHTFWKRGVQPRVYMKNCMYTDDEGWFPDKCGRMEKDVVCQHRMSEGSFDYESLIGLSGKVMVGGALARATAALWLMILAQGLPLLLGLV